MGFKILCLAMMLLGGGMIGLSGAHTYNVVSEAASHHRDLYLYEQDSLTVMFVAALFGLGLFYVGLSKMRAAK